MTDTLNYLAMLACLGLGFIVGSFKQPDVQTKIVVEKKPVLIYVEKKLAVGQHLWTHSEEFCGCEKHNDTNVDESNISDSMKEVEND